MRDKTITAACLIPDGIEWTTLKIKQDGNEIVEQSSLPCPVADSAAGYAGLAALQLGDEIEEKLAGDLTVSIRTSELLMRTMEFPTKDPDEITSMVDFQIDKVSPFPLDQLAVSHEILRETENESLVLMAAVKHQCIDAIGDTFVHKGIHIHSIDARILGWLYLLEKEKRLAGDGCEIVIVDDGIDFALVVMSNGVPLAFRSLPVPEDGGNLAGELADEIGYTLTTLDAEHELQAPETIEIWNRSEIAETTISALSARTGLAVRQNRLTLLPPLSEGIIERTQNKKIRIELIPREWVDLQKFKQLKKKFLISTAIIGVVWLAALITLTTVYQTRAIALKKVQKKEAALAPQADKAIENRKKLRALTSYADRSDSALECLREVTRMLPPGDIEFVTYKYNKNKGVTLRGTAESDDSVYEFFDALTTSELFIRLKDQRIDNKQTKGVQRAVFSVNLMLPDEEDAQ